MYIKNEKHVACASWPPHLVKPHFHHWLIAPGIRLEHHSNSTIITEFLVKRETLSLSPEDDQWLHPGIPIAKMVSCTVHCLLSNPEEPPCTQTVDAPVSSGVVPSVKVNGRGVWSTLAICDSLNLPIVDPPTLRFLPRVEWPDGNLELLISCQQAASGMYWCYAAS